MKVRDTTQDVVKGITITLVVYGHMLRGLSDAGLNNHVLSVIDLVMFSFRMPLFFVLAGYNARGALERRSAAAYVRSRWEALIYPYIVWSVLLWSFKMLAQTAQGASVNHPVHLVDLLSIGWKPISPNWFSYALLLMQLVLVAGWRKPGVLVAGALAGQVAAELWGADLREILDLTLLHAPFFMLGVWLAAYLPLPVAYAWLRRRWVFLGLLAVVAAGFWLAAQWPGFKPIGLLMMPLSLAGIGTLTAFALHVPEGRGRQALAYLGQRSLSIFLAHVVFTAMIRALMLKLGCGILLLVVVGTVVGIGAPVVMYEAAVRLRLAGWLGIARIHSRPAGAKAPALTRDRAAEPVASG